MNQAAEAIQALGLTQPTQICMVVRDLKVTTEYYQSRLSIGPFVFPQITFTDVMYHGRPAAGYWEMAFARMGHFELELVCPLRSPSIYEDFLASKGEGLHHLGFDVPSLDDVLKRATRLGIAVLMQGRTPAGGFAHLDTTRVGGTILEAIQRAAPRV